ncbi:2,3-bisphosphoglycerate-independent phosphoglycerate mutase [Candidatus Woesearchaeota archaeon]|nr:2,3-bisphosphoglycerate-independent phosphoglycerate mutase [Candidatus Woesearchaeota archaeon]
MPKKAILVIRDGWGYRKECKNNAICGTHTPNTDRLMKKYPHVLLDASGEAVGLPKGYQGNSEVGHMTIGSGRVIFQSLERINQSIKDSSFFKIPAFIGAVTNCKKNKTKLHLIGLLQTEGVHAHKDHLFALLDLCKKQNFKDVYVHVITDGRDAPVTESIEHVQDLKLKLNDIGFGKIATVSGRYYTMDRDKRWDRTKKAYDCIVNGESEIEFDDSITTIKQSHSQGVTDEFIVPRKRFRYKGISRNDSVIFYNFRTDRTRQLTKAIVEKDFEGWKRKPLDVFYVAMTQYYIPMNAKVAFKDIELKNILGEAVSKAGLKQLRISETEKYAHVTFFFNGQIETPYRNEDRVLIHSPKVATYDLKPEMSVYEITERLVREIKSKKYDLIVTNLVNGDMVGHTGVISAIKKAVSAVDDCVGKITDAGLENDYELLVFADHGNAEDQTPEWRTSHTTNPVPLIVVSKKKYKLKKGKGLKDIAPTALGILGIKKPKEMTGESIISK